MIGAHDQTQEFIAKLPAKLQERPRTAPGAPTAVWRGAMTLTADLEKRLVEHCLTRKGQLERELGRDQITTQEWWKTVGATADSVEQGVYRSHLGRRALWDMVYRGEVAWRATMYSGLFAHANHHYPVCRRLAQQTISRIQNFFFGTSPWMAITTVGKNDAPAAKVVEKWTKLGFERAQVEATFDAAIELACIRGEAVLKPTWTTKRDYYQDWLVVALDDVAKGSEPLRAADGNFITEEDEWIATETQGGPMDGTVWVLARDRQTKLPEYAVEPDDLVFDQRLLDVEVLVFEGLEMGILPKEDFLCPLNAASVDRADIVVHVQDLPTIELCHRYLEHVKKTGDAVALPEVMEFLRTAGQRVSPESHQWAKRAELGEAAQDGGRQTAQSDYRDWVPFDGSLVSVAECWVTMDVLGDGVLRNVYCLIDIKQRKAIAYDWQHRMVPEGCGRPFHVVRVNPVHGRWHGVSVCELYWPLNHIVDVGCNRITHANQGSGEFRSLEFGGLEGFDGIKAPKHFEIQPGKVYVRKKGVKHEDIFGTTPLANYNQESVFEMVQFAMQLANNLSGVSSGNDNEAAGLDSTKLATGILHLERMNQELFAPLLKHVSPGIESASRFGVMLLLEHSGDSEDAWQYFDGDEAEVELLRSITPKNFRFNLKVLLSRFKAYQQSIQVSAGRAVIEHYGSSDPNLRPAIKALCQRELEIYELDNLSATSPVDPETGEEYSMPVLDWIDQFPAPLLAAPPTASAGERATQSVNPATPTAAQ